MVLGIFGGQRAESLPELIARRKYGQAIELLRAQYQKGGGDARLRMQLADTLEAAGRRAEAIPLYLDLADGFAREGYLAKAIAVLKKVERIDRGRADVARRLAQLAAERQKPSAPARPGIEATQVIDIGMEEIGLEPHLFTPPPTAAEVPVAAPPAAPVGEPEFDLSEAAEPAAAAEPSELVFEEEFFAELAETVKGVAEPAGAAPAAPVRRVRSPLFEHFTDEEFVAVASRLELHSCAPGDIVLSEGEEGDSLFVLTTGVVKAFVRNPAGRQVFVREMGEGSFFGEISILTGKPRTATITCATPCELLELDRAALDGITRTHPRVQEVLKSFYLQRHGSGEEQKVRGQAKS